MGLPSELDFATPRVKAKKVMGRADEGGMKVTAAKLKRARAREVTQVADFVWKVSGVSGEARSAYMVRWDHATGTFVCTCHGDSYGDVRAHEGCTHDLAVRLTKPHLEMKPAPTVTPVDITPTRHLSLEDPRLYRHDNRGLPHWLKELRGHQMDAVWGIVDAFDNGADVVFVEAPTGAGKTIIGELARRMVGGAGLYVCSGLELQKQFAKDFQYAGVVKGRSNYPTLMLDSWPEITAADCDKERVGEGDSGQPEYDCTYCRRETFNCPYEIAKAEAVRNKLAALNTTYALTEWNFVGGLSGRPIVIVDEADLLEGELMNFVEFRIGPRVVRELNLTVPKKGAHGPTIEAWLRDEVGPAARDYLAKLTKAGKSPENSKRKKTYGQLVADVARVVAAGVSLGEEGGGGWVRVYETKGYGRKAETLTDRFSLRPVKVADAAARYLWGHGVRWVLMSATLVSVNELVDSLGLDQWEVKDAETGDVRPARWEEVHVPAVFPVENRAIVASGIANMTRKGQEAGGVEDLLEGIGVILREHADDNVLIHTHTYALARAVETRYGSDPAMGDRRLWTYADTNTRTDSLQGFKEHGGVLVAPSMDRGIDLPGDQCRVQVVCKLPMPYLGDAQVSARTKTRGGELWYSVQTARGLIQMTGRAVRSSSDWATTYVLDSTFGQWKKRNKGLLPGWWQDAVTYVPAKLFNQEVARRAAQHNQRREAEKG